MSFLQKTSSIEDESRTLETKVGLPSFPCDSLAESSRRRTAGMLSINRRERPPFRSFVRSRPLKVATATERVRRQTKEQRPFSCGSHTIFFFCFPFTRKERQGEREGEHWEREEGGAQRLPDRALVKLPKRAEWHKEKETKKRTSEWLVK